jgi:hypothetical protein
MKKQISIWEIKFLDVIQQQHAVSNELHCLTRLKQGHYRRRKNKKEDHNNMSIKLHLGLINGTNKIATYHRW